MGRQHHQDKMWKGLLLLPTELAKIQAVVVVISIHTYGAKQSSLHVEGQMKAEPVPSISQLLLAVVPQHLIPLFLFSPALACLLIQSVADRKSSSGPRRDVASGYGRPSLIQGQKSECPWQQRIPCSGDC